MDLFDQAQELEQMQRTAFIAEARKAPSKGPIYTGCCAYCADTVAFPRRFCDGECRSGWEQEQDAIKRNLGNNRALLDDDGDGPAAGT